MQVYEQQYLDFFEVLGAAIMLVSATLLGAEESACSFSLSDETFTISVFPYFSNETVHVVKSSDILSIVAS